VRVLVAPDCFTGTLTAAGAAAAVAEGWRRHAPSDELDLCPLSDGGPGFVEVLAGGLGGSTLAVEVTGPLGEPAAATVLLAGGPAPAGDAAAAAGDAGLTAYVETAQACGLHLVPPGRRDPGPTTTAGVAGLLEAAREAGARRIVVGLGGSGTNDAGAGLLAALAARAGLPVPAPVHARLTSGGAALAGTSSGDLAWLPALVERWSGVELVVASDVDVPLLGFHGASAGFAEQKGATPEQAQALERCLGDLAVAALDALGRDRRGTATPGAGAAGGLGFALQLLGARRVPGAQAVLDALDVPARMGRCDLVVTGEGRFDWQSLRGKVVAAVAHAGLAAGTPVVVLAGQVDVGRREARSIGVQAAYPVATTDEEVATALADPAGTLAARAARVARTWSPART